MPSPTRLSAALAALCAELTETAAWEREIAAEARRAATRREKLVESLRCTIGTLDPPDRATWLARLREILGQPEPAPIPCNTPRVRLALDWLARREHPDFAAAELSGHLRAHGHEFGRGYLSALLTRWSRAGLVTRVGNGRYRACAERIDMLG